MDRRITCLVFFFMLFIGIYCFASIILRETFLSRRRNEIYAMHELSDSTLRVFANQCSYSCRLKLNY